MKFTTFYFSGTGNTKWAVDGFNRILTEKGHQGELVSIEQEIDQEPVFFENVFQTSDYIGFAIPIYGADLPPIMRRFIERLVLFASGNQKYSKPVYFINSIGYINGFGPFNAKKLFQGTSLNLISYTNILLCNNISTPKLKMKAINPEKMKKRMELARVELCKAADSLIAGRKRIRGIGPYLLPNILVRKALRKGISENYKSFDVRMESCSQCMLCVNRCPTRSIQYSDNSFKFLSTCTACMRCYNNCPTYSILLDGKYADPNICVRYRGPDTMK